MLPSPELVANHPLNAGVRRYCEPRYSPARMPILATPDEVPNAYLVLGTHPDLVSRLWDELGKALALDCRAIFFGNPVLLHPASGVVFGFAGGTHTCALRLPEPEHGEALQSGATRVKHYPGKQRSIDLSEVGPEWLFMNWFKDEQRWCIPHARAPATREPPPRGRGDRCRGGVRRLVGAPAPARHGAHAGHAIGRRERLPQANPRPAGRRHDFARLHPAVRRGLGGRERPAGFGASLAGEQPRPS